MAGHLKILLIEGHKVETLSIGKKNYTEISCPKYQVSHMMPLALLLAHFSREIQPFVDHGNVFSVINMTQVQGHGADTEVFPCPCIYLGQLYLKAMNGGY